MSEAKSSPVNTLTTFLALYLTTLFSLDTWTAARNSPYREPSATSFYRPANRPSEYQAGMHGQGRRGTGGSGGGRREEGYRPRWICERR
ncbi:uncharacterized protein N0V89_003315 [Didymosphaeria variabile]|uniref:Uncharacterized protein n=1 Tax=Didymosphaeria variabile TaxID=1932322 RepID=A0A9W9CEG7_9PLEO|nr:uncharacterized protein N0V89_003315 [Didymosphaeria variabile]KAJ4358731.1 hypothetical protein N0V89_003315 [Didymosphaeria variabile]